MGIRGERYYCENYCVIAMCGCYTGWLRYVINYVWEVVTMSRVT